MLALIAAIMLRKRLRLLSLFFGALILLRAVKDLLSLFTDVDKFKGRYTDDILLWLIAALTLTASIILVIKPRKLYERITGIVTGIAALLPLLLFTAITMISAGSACEAADCFPLTRSITYHQEICASGAPFVNYVSVSRYLLFERIRPVTGEASSADSVKLERLHNELLSLRMFNNGNEHRVVIDLRYDDVSPLTNEYRIVERNRKWGATDMRRQEVIPVEYDHLGYCTKGLFMARKNEKTGYLDRKGNVAIPFIYDNGNDFVQDSTLVNIGNDYFYIDRKGNRLSDAPRK